MPTRNVAVNKTALAKARERRQKLDRDRDAKDQRIEEAAAEAMVALDARAEAQRALTAATADVGAALRNVLAEGVTLERAAALLEIDAGEVRRLSGKGQGGGARASVAPQGGEPAQDGKASARPAG